MTGDAGANVEGINGAFENMPRAVIPVICPSYWDDHPFLASSLPFSASFYPAYHIRLRLPCAGMSQGFYNCPTGPSPLNGRSL